MEGLSDIHSVLQYTSQAAQRYRQLLEKEAAKLSQLPSPESLADEAAPETDSSEPTSTAAPASSATTAAPLAAAAASSNGRETPQENGTADKAPAGAPKCPLRLLLQHSAVS